MKRAALIIYCDSTRSGVLPGPSHDNTNLRRFLQSNLGGDWRYDEITSLQNPYIADVKDSFASHLDVADYTFVVFSGHGYIDHRDKRQMLEVADGDISLFDLKNKANRQTIIIDACRGYDSIEDSLQKVYESNEFFSQKPSTRKLFDGAVGKADKGISVLYSASPGESSDDDDHGAPYISSLIKASEIWKENDHKNNVLTIRDVNVIGSEYMHDNYITNQLPMMNSEKRRTYFPFSVKFSPLND